MKLIPLLLLFSVQMVPLATSAQAVTAAAEQLPVTRVSQSPTGYYQVDLPDTEAGHAITCTLMNAAGQPLASNSWVSRAPTTSVPIRHAGDDVQSAVCTRN